MLVQGGGPRRPEMAINEKIGAIQVKEMRTHRGWDTLWMVQKGRRVDGIHTGPGGSRRPEIALDDEN